MAMRRYELPLNLKPRFSEPPLREWRVRRGMGKVLETTDSLPIPRAPGHRRERKAQPGRNQLRGGGKRGFANVRNDRRIRFAAPYNSVVERHALIRQSCNPSAVLAAAVFFVLVGGYPIGKMVKAQTVPDTHTSEPMVVQGRITAINGAVVRLKTPDGYPGTAGPHPQFVTAGPTLTVDVSRARVLLPDGKQPDQAPLVVGDRILMVVNRSDTQSSSSAHTTPIYVASIIERLALSDKTVTH
jgi:hypothetical protein